MFDSTTIFVNDVIKLVRFQQVLSLSPTLNNSIKTL